MFIRDPIFAAFCGSTLGVLSMYIVSRAWRRRGETSASAGYWKASVAFFVFVGGAISWTPLLYLRLAGLGRYYGWLVFAPVVVGGVVGTVVLLVPALDRLLPPVIREQVRDQQRWPPWAIRRRDG